MTEVEVLENIHELLIAMFFLMLSINITVWLIFWKRK